MSAPPADAAYFAHEAWLGRVRVGAVGGAEPERPRSAPGCGRATPQFLPASGHALMPRGRAVVSLLNTPAGLFRWYEEFPLRIGERLRAEGIDHVLGYKEYLDSTIIPASSRLVAHDETEMPNPRWIHGVLEPIVARYEQVIVHTHSYGFRECGVWRLTRGHSQRHWWATMHRTSGQRDVLRAVRRSVLQFMRIGYPDRIFGVSEASCAALRRMFLASRVRLIRNGRLDDADLAYFPPRSVPDTALFVGRLNREKGVWPLLEAGERLAATHPRFHLIIVGDGPEAATMRAWIADRRLEARIEMVGYQSDVRSYYARADFLIVPSDPQHPIAEGLPLVALEAKAFALPVLYSLSGGLPESQIEGRTGLLLDPPDATHIVESAERLLGDVDLYHAMRNAIRGERTRWGIDAMVDEYVRQYVETLAGRPAELGLA